MEDQEVDIAAKEERAVSLGDWMLAILLLAVPVVNVFALLYWAFSRRIIPSKSNFARAMLIWIVISLIIWAILLSAYGISLFEILREAPDFTDSPAY